MSASAHRRLHDPKYLQLHIPGNSHVQDVSGHGNVTTPSSVTYATGPFSGHSVAVLTTSAFVTIPTQTLTKLTFAAWVLGDGMIFSNASAGGVSRIYYDKMVLGGQVGITAEDAALLCTASGLGDTSGSWTHWAWVYDGVAATGECYRNGIGMGAATFTAGKTVILNQLFKARGSATSIRTFSGQASHCRLYNIALTGSEISALYEFDRR